MNTSMQFADLVMIWDSFKRGDYWAALTRAIALLNSLINNATPTTFAAPAAAGVVGTSRFSTGAGPTQEDWDTLLDEMEAEFGDGKTAKASHSTQVLAPPNPDGSKVDSAAVGFSFGMLPVIMGLLLEFFKRYRSQPSAAKTEAKPVTPAVKPVPVSPK